MTAHETDAARTALINALSEHGALLNTALEHEVHVQVQPGAAFVELTGKLDDDAYHLVTVVANDERELEDRRFKIYYVFSHPTADLLVTVEYLLQKGSENYQSIYDRFPAVDPFEREMVDMIGLRPEVPDKEVRAGSWLHEAYPTSLNPLRRTDTAVAIRERVATFEPALPATDWPLDAAAPGPDGMVLPVGPIHAGIIEPGQFMFSLSGEAIEDLQIRLGYAHRGIERMFQSSIGLLDGWRLAEQVSGDSSFAHSLAYCLAAETLTGADVPTAADILRVIFLELERIHNHIADLCALAEDVGLDQLAAELAVVREDLLRLNHRLTGHRYLRGVNQVGGVRLGVAFETADIRTTLERSIDTFARLGKLMVGRAGFRDRTIRVGVLTPDRARTLGVTGLTARASGIDRDSRWDHPAGAYRRVPSNTGSACTIGDTDEARAGDIYARSLVRAREVLVARQIIYTMLDAWVAVDVRDSSPLAASPRVLPESNYTPAIGIAEGFRGDVVYWLMQDKMNGIFRCKVRDPSMLNWPGLRDSVLPRNRDDDHFETLVADFPLLNKSFNLSYAGNDL